MEGLSPDLLKLPIARLGSWFHEQYGVIAFSQADFDAIAFNFKTKRRGYEPYAYGRKDNLDEDPFVKVGHNEKGPGIYDDEEAEAHMVDICQEGDVLFGLFEPNNPDIVAKVNRGAYRYTSPEIIRKAKDRDTGRPMGPFLRGLALTNTPSIPHLPRNAVIGGDILAELLSDDVEIEFFSLDLSTGDIMSTNSTPAETAAAAAPAATEVAEADKPVTMGVLATVLSELKSIFAPAKPAETPAPVAEAKPTEAELAAKAEAEKLAAEKEVAEKLAAEKEAELAAKEEALKASTAELEALRQAAAEREAAEAAEKEAADKAAAEAAEAERLAAEQAEADKARELELEAARKHEEFALMLSDRAAKLVAEGVAPVLADKAVAAIKAVKAGESAVLLSDGAEPVAIEDVIFELLSDRKGAVDFTQTGTAEGGAAPAGNPWLSPERLAKLKSQTGR